MITVLQPGLLSTVQDEGRLDYLAFGLPRAGVMDRYAARIANLICGNPLSAAVIEMTLMGGAFRFDQPCRIALCGADMAPRLNGTLMENWAATDVVPGDTLETGYVNCGCRTYLAVSGGFDLPALMGSRSTYVRANLGGLEGRALRSGDRLPIGEASPFLTAPVSLPLHFIPLYQESVLLRVMLGPQEDLFLPEGISMLLSSEYRVSEEADRMGYRLEGPEIRHKDKADIVSDALGAGAIQVPGSGQPIIMMADCGTTGGYAKIATVIGADFWKLAQAKPQDKIRFLKCSDEEAVEALAAERELYREVAQRIHDGGFSPKRGGFRQMKLKVMGQEYQIDIEEVKNDEDN